MAELLHACVRARLNIIISGGTGTGKTTLLNVLSSFIPENERIVTIEDAVELQLQQEHVVRLESRPPNIEGKGEVTIRDLVRNSLRMRPDRIVVGECRGGESLDMLQAMNTGHEGSLSTVHANSPRDALSRLETLVLMAGMDLPLRAIREQIASAVDVIVQIGRLSDGTRRVTHVTEVQGMEGDLITLQDAFVFDYSAGVDENGRFRGRRHPDGRPAEVHRPVPGTRHYRVPRGVCHPARCPAEPMSKTWILIAGLLTCLTAIIAAFIAFGGWRSTRLPVERRTRPGTADPEGALAGPTRRLAQTLEAGIGTTRRAQLAAALDLAGITLGPGDFLLIVAAATLAAAAVGLVTVGPITAVLMALLPALIASVTLKFRTGRRRASFADQLEDSLQLLAGSLRAGHSLLRAMDAAAAESESPTSTEFRRVINETRIGRPLGAALDDVAIRMYSKDFAWITQAIAIHRKSAGTWRRYSTPLAQRSGNATRSGARSKRSAPKAGCPESF